MGADHGRRSGAALLQHYALLQVELQRLKAQVEQQNQQQQPIESTFPQSHLTLVSLVDDLERIHTERMRMSRAVCPKIPEMESYSDWEEDEMPGAHAPFIPQGSTAIRGAASSAVPVQLDMLLQDLEDLHVRHSHAMAVLLGRSPTKTPVGTPAEISFSSSDKEWSGCAVETAVDCKKALALVTPTAAMDAMIQQQLLLKDAQAEIHDLQQRLEQANDDADRLQNSLADTEHELYHAQENVDDRDLQIMVLQQKIGWMELLYDDDKGDDYLESCVAHQPTPSNVEELQLENQALRTSVANLRTHLQRTNALVEDLESDRRVLRAKVTELSRQPDSTISDADMHQLLYEKGLECVELTASNETLRREVQTHRNRCEKLQRENRVTRVLIEELSTSWDQAASADENVQNLRRDRDRSLEKAAELSVELANTKMRLDTMTEQLRSEIKDNNAANKLDLAGLLGRKMNSSITEMGLVDSWRNLRSEPLKTKKTPIVPTVAGDGDAEVIRNLAKTISDLEAQNVVYGSTVAHLRREIDHKESELDRFLPTI